MGAGFTGDGVAVGILLVFSFRVIFFSTHGSIVLKGFIFVERNNHGITDAGCPKPGAGFVRGWEAHRSGCGRNVVERAGASRPNSAKSVVAGRVSLRADATRAGNRSFTRFAGLRRGLRQRSDVGTQGPEQTLRCLVRVVLLGSPTGNTPRDTTTRREEARVISASVSREADRRSGTEAAVAPVCVPHRA